jgi:hypothetical protein
MATQAPSQINWLDRLLKIGPLLTGLKWIFDNWPVVLGSGSMIYAASITEWLKDWGPVAYVAIGIITASVIALVSALVQLVHAKLSLRQHEARYFHFLEKAQNTFNPRTKQHYKEVLKISDMFSPISSAIEGKSFDDCDFIGPGAIILITANTVSQNVFYDQGDIVFVPKGTQVVGALALIDCTIKNSRFWRVSFVTDNEVELNWFLEIGFRDPRVPVKSTNSSDFVPM